MITSKWKYKSKIEKKTFKTIFFLSKNYKNCKKGQKNCWNKITWTIKNFKIFSKCLKETEPFCRYKPSKISRNESLKYSIISSFHWNRASGICRVKDGCVTNAPNAQNTPWFSNKNSFKIFYWTAWNKNQKIAKKNRNSITAQKPENTEMFFLMSCN